MSWLLSVLFTDEKTKAVLEKMSYLPRFSNQSLSNTEFESNSILFQKLLELFFQSNQNENTVKNIKGKQEMGP